VASVTSQSLDAREFLLDVDEILERAIAKCRTCDSRVRVSRQTPAKRLHIEQLQLMAVTGIEGSLILTAPQWQLPKSMTQTADLI
jgi:hypothetical protein